MCPIIVRYIGGSNINFEGLLVIIYIIGRAGASPPSRATGLNFLYMYIYF